MTNWATSFLLTSLVMSTIILIIMLCNKLFSKKYSAKFRYTIWIIVLVGLIIPFRPIIGDGLISVQAPESVQMQPDSSEVLPVGDNGNVQNATSAETSETTSVSSPISLFTVCIWAWGIITFTILSYHIWRYLRFTRMIGRWGVPVEEERILSVFQSVQNDLGLSNKKVNLKVCNFVSSSMLTGFFHPVILLPDKDFDEDELELIFRHELIHYKQHDLFIKFLIVLATSIHWFNPVVHWMCSVMQTDGETSCDEAVLQDTDIENRRFYGEVIIGMIGNKNTAKTALSTCFYAGKSNMKRRLDSIMDTKQKKRKSAIIAVAIVAAVTLFSGSVIALNNNNNNSRSAASISKITMEKAKEVALAKAGGGTVAKLKTDKENGREVYEITIMNGDKKVEMDVDVITGAITNYEEEVVTQSSNATSSATQSATQSAKKSSTTSSKITAAKAKKIALAKVGGGSVTKCKVDYENGRKVYEIDIVKGSKKYEMDVDAITGAISKYEVETINQSNSTKSSTTKSTKKSSSTNSKITAAKAKKIALAKVGGGTVTKCKVDVENGRKVYEIEIVKGNKEYEMDVDAISGAIRKYEAESLSRDHDDDDDDDHDDD